MLSTLLSSLALFGLSLGTSTLEPFVYANFDFDATYSVANQLNFFEAYGLNVTFSLIPNSTYAYNAVLTGGYDLLVGTIDNVINRRFNNNVTLSVLGQLDYGPDLVYAGSANITSFAQLRGKPIIVDSPVSGFILSINGLNLQNGDYTLQAVGGTALRYPPLIAGVLPNGSAVYSTILSYPFTGYGEALPAGSRPNILGRVSDYIDPIVSDVFTVRQSSLSNTAESNNLVKFLAAMYTANRVLQNAKNEKCVVKILEKQLNVTENVAKIEYAAVTNNVTGERSVGSNFTVDRLGLLNVIDIRSQFGGFANVSATFNYSNAIIPGSGKLIDYTIRDAALKLFKKDLLNIKC